MKLNQIVTIASSGIVGIFAGMLLSSGQPKNISQTLSTSVLVGLSIGVSSQIISSNKLASKDRELVTQKRKLDVFTSKMSKLNNFFTGVLALKLSLIDENKRLVIELEKVQQQLLDCGSNDLINIAKISGINNQLVESKKIISTLETKINRLELEAKQADEDFDRSLEYQTQERIRALKIQYIDTLTQPYDDIIEDALILKNRIVEVAKKLKNRSDDRKEFVLGYADKLNDIAGRANENFEREKQSYLEQIELLNEKVGRFQQLANGNLVEPIFKEVGYALHGRIANDIAKELFRSSGIPLEVFGYQQSEETTRVGYGFSKNANSEDIVNVFNQISPDIAKELKIYAITNIELSAISPVINLTFRKEPPKPESIDEIYKAGLIPASQFCDIVAKATDHKTKGKPTLRVMAATGEGKGIVMKNLLAYFTNIENFELWLSDPVDGSDEDYWDCPKIAKNAEDAKKAYKLFCDLHHDRHELKQAGFTDRKILGIFDEFDKQHSDKDKEKAKEIMTAIRHSNQRQILIGQCAEVGSNGWTWDDMNNCALLVLGASIGTLCKHLTKDMGWTIKKANTIKKEYEHFSTWANNQNENNPNIPAENQTRIGLLVAGDRYHFLELPIAHKGILRDGKSIFRDSFTASDTPKNQIFEKLPTNPICPTCGSKNTKPYGRDGRYQCLDYKTPECGQRTFRLKK